MDNFIILLLVGLAAGILSGLFGVGGGLLIVPALTLFLAFSAKTAVATSLAALLLPVGIFAVIEYHRKGLVDLRASLLIAVGLFTTTLLGAQITLALPDTLFKQAYGVFVIIIGLRFLGIFARMSSNTPRSMSFFTLAIASLLLRHASNFARSSPVSSAYPRRSSSPSAS